MRSRLREIVVVVSFAALGIPAGAAPAAPELRSVASFALLGGSAVTSSHRSRIIGNVGVSPGATITGITPEDISIGRIARNDVAAREARKDADAAYTDLERACDVHVTGEVIGETVLHGGVYCFAANARLTGTLTLEGDRDAVWIFQVRGTLVADAQSAVAVMGGGSDAHVFWQVRDAATIGEESSFRGTILAGSDVTLKAGASLSGRAIAQAGRVTLDDNDISLCCEPIDITPLTLSGGTVGTEYSQTLAAHGGSESYTFRIADQPGWLHLDGNALFGMPEEGTFTFTAIATDNLTRCTGRRRYTIHVSPIVVPCRPIVFSPSTLPIARVGIAYERTLTPSGGTGPYTFTFAPPVLPNNFYYEQADETGSAIRILGTPTAVGIMNFTITVTDANGCSGSQSYSLRVRLINTSTDVPALSPSALLILAMLVAGAAVLALGRLR